jgi:hypothetical protein
MSTVKKTQAKKLTATTMRNILAFLLVVIVLGSVAGFYFGLQLVKSYALDVSHTVSDSNASAKNVQELGQLKQQLVTGQALVSKADELFSTPDTYQTQALKDISKYAADSGISISSIDSSGSAQAATTPSYSETVALQSPVSYAKFLQFLDDIQGNLPKMQITGISIARPANPSGDQITTDKITITVSIS